MKAKIGGVCKNATFESRDAVCPHCGLECRVRQGNGVYECPGCDEPFEVDLWTVPHVHQPDGITCGWATAKWLLSAFGCKVPSDRMLEKELHVRMGKDGVTGAVTSGINRVIRGIGSRWNWQGIPEDGGGTLPTNLVATLWKHGLRPVFPGFTGLWNFSDYKDYMESVFARHGRFAMFYKNSVNWHWIGIEKFGRGVRAMDPTNWTYVPFSSHEVIRSKRVSVACMIGFVRA